MKTTYRIIYSDGSMHNLDLPDNVTITDARPYIIGNWLTIAKNRQIQAIKLVKICQEIG